MINFSVKPREIKDSNLKQSIDPNVLDEMTFSSGDTSDTNLF